ncbi:MAG: phosphoglucosamine mutase [Acidobacteriota bacterium]
MGRLFGTDGIRGVAGEFPLSPPALFSFGESLVRLGKRDVLIGRDTRASGPWIQSLLEEAIHRRGGQVTSVGVITTPGVSFLCRTTPFDVAVVISASHNPHRDNGLKLFSPSGLKLSDDEESEIEQMLTSAGGAKSRFAPEKPASGEVTYFQPSAIRPYIDFLKRIPKEGSLRSLKLVLDCAHGAAFHIAPQVFAELGAEVTTLFHHPDGNNINRGCGALHPQRMAETVVRTGASLGVAFDGDGDRAIFADEHGNLIDGDHVLYVLGRSLHREGKLTSGCVVTTVMANLGLERALRREGLRMVRTAVGDRQVLKEMLRGGHGLGGEQSGHTIIREHSCAGDGILTALAVAGLVRLEGQPLSRLCRAVKKLPQVLLNVAVRRKADFSAVSRIQRTIKSAENALGERGRVVIRYSGTEPLARVMLEGECEEEIRGYAQAIAESFRETLGT